MRTLLLCGLLMLSSCAQNPEPPILTDYQLSTLRWSSTDLPLNLKVSDAFDSPAQILFTEMEHVWEQSTGMIFYQTFSEIPNKEFTKLSDYYYQDYTDMGIYRATSLVEDLGSGSLAAAQMFY